ncbi:MAG: ergothioneine biosynthesis protein EgtB [Thaumarchaeota archaeon]|nr:ergothioneine biosynthesis protein EgtB [Nitrososphaerota archaeon]
MTQMLGASIGSLCSEFTEVREKTLNIFRPLNVEDAVIQSDVFGSPPNWHLAHTTWFFQKILEKHNIKLELTQQINTEYLNSYYQKFGKILPKAERGRFPRPTVKDTLKYRLSMEKEVISFLKNVESSNQVLEELEYDIMLANNHEMQHQELMIYDLQHYFQHFPDPEDNYKPITIRRSQRNPEKPTGMVQIPGGIYELGFNGKGFCYDNEVPEHKVYLYPFKIDIAPITNGEYMKFIEDGGYEEFRYWLADGWDIIKEEGWKAPLYWVREDDKWMKKDFRGYCEIDPDEPVNNVSYYEADAYARWTGKRLPTEAEWEKAASWNEDMQRKTLYPWGDEKPIAKYSNLLESYIWAPTKIGSYPKGSSYYGCHQMIGDVWEWTSSEYILYPRFKSKFSEYTDKWVINQKVVRGGSFATPVNQIRNSYRNYFRPNDRILFAGFRCVKDI